jgi:cytoskeletal protein RodZ
MSLSGFGFQTWLNLFPLPARNERIKIMTSKRSASNVLEFLIATLVLSCLLAILIPVAYKVHETSENIHYTNQVKQQDATKGRSMEKAGASKQRTESTRVAIAQIDRRSSR